MYVFLKVQYASSLYMLLVYHFIKIHITPRFVSKLHCMDIWHFHPHKACVSGHVLTAVNRDPKDDWEVDHFHCVIFFLLYAKYKYIFMIH